MEHKEINRKIAIVRLMTKSVTMKTYKWNDEWREASGFIRAESASKARYLIYLQARDFGIDAEFADIRIRRCKEADYYVPLWDGSLVPVRWMPLF